MAHRLGLYLAVLVGGSLSGPVSAWAETRALVVGIDGYKYVKPLRGAENDARDITATLAGRGVRDVVHLDSTTASRASVLKALDAMVSRTKSGDLVIIAFAGHGATEQWGAVRPAGTRLGEAYTVFLLPDFEPPSLDGHPPRRGAFEQRILGREMNARLRQLERKGARTIFVADTCHGGGLTRDVSPEAETGMSFRVQDPYPPPDADDPAVDAAAKIEGGDFDHLAGLPGLTFLAAVDKTRKAPELPIPPGSRTMRGALSYSFARALEGEADGDHDGKLTRNELFYYLRSNVRQISGFIQEPEVQPLGADRVTVVDLKRDLSSPPPAASQASAPRQVRILVEGAPGSLPARARGAGMKIVPALARTEADLVWTPATQQMWTAAGDLVAENVTPAAIDPIAEREVARRELLSLARSRPLAVTLDGGDTIRRKGERVVARVATDQGCGTGPGRCRGPYHVVFNIAGDGTLQYLFPRNKDIHAKFAGLTDAPTLDLDQPLLRMSVTPPYGTDTLVVVTAPQPLTGLATALASMDGQAEPLDIMTAFERFLPGEAKIATQAIFTRP